MHRLLQHPPPGGGARPGAVGNGLLRGLASRRPRPGAALPRAGGVQGERADDAGGHRRRGARARHRRREPRGQLRGPRRGGDIRAPDRPHRPRRGYRGSRDARRQQGDAELHPDRQQQGVRHGGDHRLEADATAQGAVGRLLRSRRTRAGRSAPSAAERRPRRRSRATRGTRSFRA